MKPTDDSVFALYYDEGLQRPTPYRAGGAYLTKAKDRMDRTFALIEGAVRGSRILDIGASPFYLLFRAKMAGAKECHGMYFAHDQHPLKEVTAIYSAAGPIALSHADIENESLPFPTNSLDIVTACEILEHCEHFPKRLAEEIRRVLRPGGLLCITVPNVCSVGNIAKLILQRNIYMKYRSDATGRHKHEFTHSQIMAFIDYLEMDVIKSGFFPSPTSDLFRLRPIYRVIASIPFIKRYSPNLFVLAKQRTPKGSGSLDNFPGTLYDHSRSTED